LTYLRADSRRGRSFCGGKDGGVNDDIFWVVFYLCFSFLSLQFLPFSSSYPPFATY